MAHLWESEYCNQHTDGLKTCKHQNAPNRDGFPRSRNAKRQGNADRDAASMAVRVRHRRGYPVAGLTFDTSGNLYGAGAGGGANGTGVVFEYRRNRMVGRTRSRYSFGKYPASGDGFAPNSLLVFDSNGNMYGITNEGGGDTGCFNGCGAAFKL